MISPWTIAFASGFGVACSVVGVLLAILRLFSSDEGPTNQDVDPVLKGLEVLLQAVKSIPNREEEVARLSRAGDHLNELLYAERVENDALRALNDRLSKNVLRERDEHEKTKRACRSLNEALRSVSEKLGIQTNRANQLEADLATRDEGRVKLVKDNASLRDQLWKANQELGHYRKQYFDELK
jgi:chromosome segregation ATPase